MTEQRLILVTGATGKVGRHVVGGLLGAGWEVRALSRDPASADLPDGVEVVRGDLFEPGSVAAALGGVGSVFLLWPAFTADGAAPVVRAIAKRARRVVYLSAFGTGDGERAMGVWGDVEQLIEQSGLDWTFLRAGGFAANTLMWADQIREGVVRWPYGDARRSLIHEADIAAVAVRALTEDGHVGGKYPLTGPEAVSQADQVRIIGEAIGRPIRWEELSREQAREQLLAAWGDASFVDYALDSWATLVTTPEPVTTTVQDVTGRPARTFGQWATDHAGDFR
ncbi:MAG: SDR family oxidoreductase [Egibacteraceae bacterium]